jgi:hypothetical protein
MILVVEPGPSTILRMVPLPTGSGSGEERERVMEVRNSSLERSGGEGNRRRRWRGPFPGHPTFGAPE